jgi:hypothetical protein
MATPAPELYDRKLILDVIERDCLGDPGSSGVIVGSQKVGKTYLLNHVSTVCNRGKDSVFCRLNIDDLEAAGFSDDSFMRLFLSELQDIVTANVGDLEGKESTWQDDLAKLEVASGLVPGQREAIKAGLDELFGFREIVKQIQKLLGCPSPRYTGKARRLMECVKRTCAWSVLLRMVPEPRKLYEKSIVFFFSTETDRAARCSLARLAKRQGGFDLACELWKNAFGNSPHGYETCEQSTDCQSVDKCGSAGLLGAPVCHLCGRFSFHSACERACCTIFTKTFRVSP